MRRLAPGFLACAVLSVLVGCGHVKPHERELLSRPSMDSAIAENGEAAFQGHLHESREGATYNSGAGGGGCGCN